MENVVHKIMSISSRPQLVNLYVDSYMHIISRDNTFMAACKIVR